MKNPLRTETSTSLGLLLVRVPLGVYFAIAGISKFKMGTSNFVDASIGTVPQWSWFKPEWGKFYLQALPYAEIGVGAMIVLGLLTRLNGFLVSLMLTSFIIAATGIKHAQSPFHPNVIYLGVGLLLFLAGGGKFSLDGLFFGRKKSFGTE